MLGSLKAGLRPYCSVNFLYFLVLENLKCSVYVYIIIHSSQVTYGTNVVICFACVILLMQAQSHTTVDIILVYVVCISSQHMRWIFQKKKKISPPSFIEL